MRTKWRVWLAKFAVVSLTAITAITGNSSAQAASLSQADVFSPTKITAIELTIPGESESALNSVSTAKIYTAASFKFITNGLSLGPISVGLRLKGSTSLELLNRNPSFKVSFNWKLLKGNRFLGLKNLTLNAMTQDGSKLHEYGAYKLFNLMGVPAPRTGFTELKINGVSRGLYLSLETVDDIFLNSKFKDVTQHLYEGIALEDLKRGNDDGGENSGSYLVKEGWKAKSDKTDLAKLITAANYSSGSKWWDKLGTVMDRTSLLKMFAVENFASHWDGYTGPLQNNHFLRSNILGKFTMIPWGTDQTFGENRQTRTLGDDYFMSMDKSTAGFPWVQQAFKKDALPRALLFTKCLAYSVCKKAYLTQLKAVSAKVTNVKFVTSLKSASTLIASFSAPDVKDEQVRVQKWVAKQQAKVATLLKANGIR